MLDNIKRIIHNLIGNHEIVYTVLVTAIVINSMIYIYIKWNSSNQNNKNNSKKDAENKQHTNDEDRSQTTIESEPSKYIPIKVSSEYIKSKYPKKQGEPLKYETGWQYNEETGLWDPPDSLSKESKRKWRWNPEKGIWIDIEKERRLERYKKYREGKEPTYEEWKAEKMKKQ